VPNSSSVVPKDAEEQLDKLVDQVIGALRRPEVLRRVGRRAWAGPDQKILRTLIREMTDQLAANLPALAEAFIELAPTVEHYYRREGKRLIPIQAEVEVG
jgi:hypothetical protein